MRFISTVNDNSYEPNDINGSVLLANKISEVSEITAEV